jgi:hypothetical protein
MGFKKLILLSAQLKTKDKAFETSVSLYLSTVQMSVRGG